MNALKLLLALLPLLVLGCGPSHSGVSYHIDETVRDRVAPVTSVRDGGTVFEKSAASILRGHARQKRKSLVYDSRLNRVARSRARDMAKRGYFNHIDPDGKGPNYHVQRAGYRLPAAWKSTRKSNYVESILSGPKTPQTAMAAFLNSRAHRKHILASDSFYAGHTRYGMGHYHDPSSVYKHYWIFISAPPEGSEF